MRLPVLRFALVILCLPRADGSEPFTGCQKYAADEFFSTDLSSGVFPHNGDDNPDQQIVPDDECDMEIDPDWTTPLGQSGPAKMIWVWLEYMLRNFGKTNPKTGNANKQTICVHPGTCEWPPFEPRSHLNLRILLTPCFAPCSVRHGLHFASDWSNAWPDAESKGPE